MRRHFVIIICLLIGSQILASSGDAAHFVRRAQEKYRLHDYAGAIVEYSRAISIDSTSAVLYNNRGLCRYKIQEYTDAIHDYRIALRFDSSMANAWFNLGNCQTAIVAYEEAIHSFDRAIHHKRDFIKAYTNRATVLFYLEDYRGALQDYQHAISMSVIQDKSLFLSRGNAHYMLRQYDSAIMDFTKAIALDPEYYKAYINRGICKLDKGDAEAAIRDFTLSIRYSSMDGEPYYYRAMANVYRMREIHNEFNEDKEGSLVDFKIYNELACSDLSKAKAFAYSKAFEASDAYCNLD